MELSERHQPSRAKRTTAWTIAALVVAGLAAFAVYEGMTGRSEAEATGGHEPALVEPLGKSGLHRIVLEARAAGRIGLETVPVRTVTIGGKARQVIPYSAVLYDVNGKAWVYTSPEPLVFVRAPIQIVSISGDRAVLSKGPSTGTEIVSVGVSELFGAETGVGEH